MAENKTGSEANAVELLQNAKEIPRPGQGADFEIPTLFGGGMPGTSPFVNSDTPAEVPGPQVLMKCVSRTYTIWRPYEGCNRCQNALSSGEAVLPEASGDYTCPHVQTEEYQAQVDRILSGTAMKQYEEHFMLKNGLRCVHLIWLEPSSEAIKKIQEKKKRQEELPYPPRPEKVFAQPIEEEDRTKS